jgi:hypothetical protein
LNNPGGHLSFSEQSQMKRMMKFTLLAAPLALAIIFTATAGVSAADSAK